MERLGGQIDRELARFGPATRIGELLRLWESIAGDAIARNAVPARLARDGTLHVAASSSAWAFELAQLEPTLLARLRDALGGDAPARLRFAVGPLPEPAREPTSGSPRARIEPTERDRAAAAELASEIADEELRALVSRAAAASLARAADNRSF